MSCMGNCERTFPSWNTTLNQPILSAFTVQSQKGENASLRAL
jgi:hypothetical protein